MSICGRCGKEFDGYPAISRKDNKTEICPECGAREALEAANMSEDEVAEMLSMFRSKSALETLIDIDNRLVPDVLPGTDPEISALESRIEQEIIAAGVADDITAADLEALTERNYHTVERAAARIRKLRSLSKHRIVATRATGKAIEDPATAVYISGCLDACFSGDYGLMPPEDVDSNDLELASGEGRIVARYEQQEQLREDIYIISYFSEQEPDDDNNFTEILYVSEY